MHPSVLTGDRPPDPYRLFFPLGILLGLFGVSVWPIYYLGWGVAPSAAGHVGLQIQGFVMSFAIGFLLTAAPRFVGAPPIGLRRQALLALLLAVAAIGFWLDRHRLAEGSFTAMMLLLGLTMARTLRARVNPPPEPFVAVLVGLAAGLAGSVLKLLVLAGLVDPGLMLLGRRLLSEGMILLFVLGIGGKLGPLFLGYPTATPRARWTHGGAALVVLASIVAQYGLGWEPAAWARAAAVALVVGLNTRFWRRPETRSALSWGTLLAHWMLLIGLVGSAAVPAYRVELLHLVFVGGFSILILVVAMRVVLAHGGYPLAWEVRSWPLRIGMGLLVMATMARVGARFAADTYLLHLAIAGWVWMAGLLVWGTVLVRRILVPWRAPVPSAPR